MVISVKAKVIVYHLGEEEGKGGRGGGEGGIKDFGVTLKHAKIFEIFLRSPLPLNSIYLAVAWRRLISHLFPLKTM